MPPRSLFYVAGTGEMQVLKFSLYLFFLLALNPHVPSPPQLEELRPALTWPASTAGTWPTGRSLEFTLGRDRLLRNGPGRCL